MRKSRREKVKKLTRLEKTAYHEAGHAVAYHFLRIPFKKVSIEEGEDSHGVAIRKGFPKSYNPETDEGGLKNRIIMEKAIIAMLAGEAAEFLITGRRNLVGASHDYKRAINHASYYIGNNNELEVFIRYMRIRTVNWLKNPLHRNALDVVAKELLRNKILKASEVKKVIKEMLNDI